MFRDSLPWVVVEITFRRQLKTYASASTPRSVFTPPFRDDHWPAGLLDVHPRSATLSQPLRMAASGRFLSVVDHLSSVAGNVAEAGKAALAGLNCIHSSGSPALRRPSNSGGMFTEWVCCHLRVRWGLRRRASAKADVASSILPSSA